MLIMQVSKLIKFFCNTRLVPYCHKELYELGRTFSGFGIGGALPFRQSTKANTHWFLSLKLSPRHLFTVSGKFCKFQVIKYVSLGGRKTKSGILKEMGYRTSYTMLWSIRCDPHIMRFSRPIMFKLIWTRT